MNKIFVGLGIGVVGIAGGWLWYYQNQENNAEKTTIIQPVVESQKQEEASAPTAPPEESVQQKEIVASGYDALETPFVVQAPYGEWSNPLFENGCEEASMLMVAKLFSGVTSVSLDEAKQELFAIAAYENKVFGHAFDTNAADTARILREYLEIENDVIEPESEADLQELLLEKNILIVPTDGQKLQNPFFKAPGPETHMLVVLVYDKKTDEYIVHDPGTKRGEQYRYKSAVLWDATEDYPTGATHLPKSKKEKRVIVVSLK